ncbi:hypothetical protein D9M68_999800 [compost metagenome]
MQLQHQQREDDEDDQRHVGSDRLLSLPAVRCDTGQFYFVTGRQLRAQTFKRGFELCRHGRSLYAVCHVGLHGDRPFPAFTPDDAGLPDKANLGELR